MSKNNNRFAYAIILVKEITKTDFKLRYNNSALGYMWSVLKPLALFTILYIVFTKIFRIGDAIPHYPVYLLSGLVVWNFFTESTNGSVAAIVEKGDLLRKINFPKYVILLSKVLSAIINLVISCSVVAIFMILFGTTVHLTAIFIPLLLVELAMFTFGLGLILSTIYVRFRDIGHIWEILLQGFFYLTPIIYPLQFVYKNFSPDVARLILLNPVAQVIQDIRYGVVTHDTYTFIQLFGNEWWRLIPISITIAVFVGGLFIFKRRAAYFAEYV